MSEKGNKHQGEKDQQGEEKQTHQASEIIGRSLGAATAGGKSQKTDDIEKARQDRKRNREQQRRNALNDGIDRLLQLVFAIDPQLKVEAEERARTGSSRGRVPSVEHCLLSRVEILDHGIATLQRVNRENEDRKVIIGRLMAEKGGKNNEDPSPPQAANAAATQPTPPSLANPLIPNAQDIQRQTFLQQLNLGALIAAASGASGFNLSASLGLSAPPPPLQNVLELVLQARNAAGAASLLGLSQAAAPNNNLSSLLNSGRDTLPGDSTYYRALLNKKIQEEESAAAALLGALGNTGASGLAGSGPIGRATTNPPPPSPLDTLGQVASNSVRQVLNREQTIAEAAAARKLQLETLEDGSPAANKRMKRSSS